MKHIHLPDHNPEIPQAVITAARRIIEELHRNGYKLRFEGDWITTPHFHARVPGTTMWLHIRVTEETDIRFLSRLNMPDTHHSRRDTAGRYA